LENRHVAQRKSSQNVTSYPEQLSLAIPQRALAMTIKISWETNRDIAWYVGLVVTVSQFETVSGRRLQKPTTEPLCWVPVTIE